MLRPILNLSLALTILGSAAMASAQEGERSLDAARQRLEYEPNVSQTMQACLRYFRVDADSFDSLRSASHWRAILPTLSAGYRFDDEQFDRFERQEITAPRENDENQQRRFNVVSVGGVWDLRELVFNPAEIQVYGLIGVQRDLMLESTRVYYLRRQLFVRFLTNPPEDPVAREALLLRIDEFTALLDVLTGGWFSRTTEARTARRQRSR